MEQKPKSMSLTTTVSVIVPVMENNRQNSLLSVPEEAAADYVARAFSTLPHEAYTSVAQQLHNLRSNNLAAPWLLSSSADAAVRPRIKWQLVEPNSLPVANPDDDARCTDVPLTTGDFSQELHELESIVYAGNLPIEDRTVLPPAFKPSFRTWPQDKKREPYDM